MDVIRMANALSAEQLLGLSDGVHLQRTRDLPYRIAMSNELQDHNMRGIWNIFQENMRDLYVNSSFGWNPATKREELFHPTSRFILVSGDDASSIAAYATFRFEEEEGEAVLYCYELQVSRNNRRRGLGTYLVEKLEAIGRRCNMKKLMLTVMKANEDAMSFYNAVGFVQDPTSPDYFDSTSEGSWEDEEDDAVDYEILSKTLS